MIKHKQSSCSSSELHHHNFWFQRNILKEQKTRQRKQCENLIRSKTLRNRTIDPCNDIDETENKNTQQNKARQKDYLFLNLSSFKNKKIVYFCFNVQKDIKMTSMKATSKSFNQ